MHRHLFIAFNVCKRHVPKTGETLGDHSMDMRIAAVFAENQPQGVAKEAPPKQFNRSHAAKCCGWSKDDTAAILTHF